MQKYIAFISGLPLGRNEISGEQLRAAIVRLGFMNVEPFLNSGNIAFETSPVGVIGPLEAQISRHIKRTFGLDDVWTFIRTAAELESIIAGVPFPAEEIQDKGNSIFVVLLPTELSELTARRIQVKRNDVDVLRPSGRQVYWLRRASRGEHVAPPALSELLDGPATVRGLQTLKQIVAQLDTPKQAKPKLVRLEDATRSERFRQ